MYNSLIANCTEDFNLWVLCMDDLTFELLEKMNLPKIKLITLKEFESPVLLKIKKGRDVAEYSWTCASNFIWFLLQKNKELEMIIYLDADLYFFNDPKILIKELKDKDVMITEHRYTKKYNQLLVSGKYCIQFIIFKNNPNGLTILDWWRQACLDWCFGYLNNNRFGDQKYLDDWLTRFKSVHELQHLGGGIAPWNIQQYDFTIKNNKILGNVKKKNDNWPVIFYHFHSFCLISPTKYFPIRGYDLAKNAQTIIYEPYFKSLQKNIKFVKNFSHNFNFGFKSISIKERLVSWFSRFGFMKLIIRFYKLVKSKLYDQKNKS
ncbi:glycosyl transferase [Patescibacteria group bacterium]|nr:glycosyl transferase [Patescibacteria group bacterium]MBU1663621.1 glycosyl transferase [Patescibacteria group bacterium]MBU1933852.1 glycosyl transferase [Patescibacteria group bacterium]MBU2007759.1 glycosyl transferase [Patescibacteria group bacterium]MBU2233487.1 glycosyl transferase [Patescibacteria group bacterium]